MTSFKISLKNMVAREANRTNAISIREKILSLLDAHDSVQLDLENVNLTPSVADEIIGALALQFGAEKFKQKIQVVNFTESQKALMNHVISRRLKLLQVKTSK